MTKSVEADVVLNGAELPVRQRAPEIQAYGHLVRMPVARSENVRKESVKNLNQLDAVAGCEFLDDYIRLRD